MLNIHSSVLEAMLEHAQADHPIEACGLLVGTVSGGKPLRVVPMRNASNSKDAFSFDSREYLGVWRELEASGDAVVAIYHSHTASQAYPSREDVLFAQDPNIHHVIVSTLPDASPAVRSFRVNQGVVVEESIRLISGGA
jgi:proteasome lid subunit RPN8/RPN11